VDNGHTFVERFAKNTNVLALQETKFRDKHHHDTFKFHLDHALGRGKYYLATNDPRVDPAYVPGPEENMTHRSSGVALLFDDTIPGFAGLRHMSECDIPFKYMVVTTQWQGVPVYFHSVYAPVHSDERAAFFDALPRDFPEHGIHMIMGDFNLPIDPRRDAERLHHRHNNGRTQLLEWLSGLHVIDAWRWHNTETKVYTGPQKSTQC
jgi:hypothetical protein